MARIRTIKPEFPQSESTGRLSRDARLLFIQLWTIVDDEGRARAASRMLASLLYPYDDDAPKLIGRWLGELERAGHIRRYEVEGSTYLDIPNWLKHQKIDKPSKSRLPAFDGNSAKPRECSRNLATDLGPSTVDLVPSTDCDANASLGRSAKPTRPSDVFFEEFWKVYPKRGGANPKEPARKKFLAVVKSGTDPSSIILAARAYASEQQKLGNVGTSYVAQVVTWLNQQRWGDYEARAPTPENQAEREAFMSARGYHWNGERWEKAEESAA